VSLTTSPTFSCIFSGVKGEDTQTERRSHNFLSFLNKERRLIEVEGLPSHKQMFLLFHSQDVSAQRDRHKVIRGNYKNDDGIL
jgi:hypothetical protein